MKLSETEKLRRKLRYATDPAFRADSKARAKAWRIANVERSKATKAAYRAKHSKELAAAQLARYYKDPARFKLEHSAYRKKNPNMMKDWHKKQTVEVTESYARNKLSQYSILPTSAWPDELVKAKQMQIKIKRLLKTR